MAHGSYGIGGIIAPIIGTALVSQGILWSRFYIGTGILRLGCIAFAAFAFWSYQEDAEPTLLTALQATASRQTAAEEAVSKMRNLKQALKNRTTIFGALFIFAYQGAEVAISGWFISYLINYRNGDPSKVGYVTAGFWVSKLPSHIWQDINHHTGRHHTWPLYLDPSCSSHRGAEYGRRFNIRNLGPTASRLAHTQPDCELGRGVSPRSPLGPHLPMRTNSLRAYPTSTRADHCYWLHRRRRKLRWRRGSLHHRYPCASSRHVGLASCVYRVVRGDDGLLIQLAKSQQEDGVSFLLCWERLIVVSRCISIARDLSHIVRWRWRCVQGGDGGVGRGSCAAQSHHDIIGARACRSCNICGGIPSLLCVKAVR